MGLKRVERWGDLASIRNSRTSSSGWSRRTAIEATSICNCLTSREIDHVPVEDTLGQALRTRHLPSESTSPSSASRPAIAATHVFCLPRWARTSVARRNAAPDLVTSPQRRAPTPHCPDCRHPTSEPRAGWPAPIRGLRATSPRARSRRSPARELALFHGALSFAFNTIVLALSINVIAGLL